MQRKTIYRCTIMRGGTSKGIFLMEKDLPQDPKLRDRVILAIFGSPDLRQIDGLGGADSLQQAGHSFSLKGARTGY